MATAQIGNELHASKLELNNRIADIKDQKSIIIPTNFTWTNVPADFEIDIALYRKFSYLLLILGHFFKLKTLWHLFMEL